jgi:hypothetical protein
MDKLEIFDVKQNTPEWFACRLGIPTASQFKTVLASGRGGGDSKTRRKYMLQLIGERRTGKPTESFSNGAMERGHEMEDEARAAYSMRYDVDLLPCGFMRRGRKGASLDRLIGTDGAAEIKTHVPHIHFEIMLAGKLPPENKAQVQGQLLVSGRAWIDLVSYWPGLPMFKFREERDSAYLAELSVAIDDFNGELDALEERIFGNAA